MYQFKYQPTPKNILLDLMGVNADQCLSTAHLGLISDAFQISINNLRVTLNRLSTTGLVTTDERGIYRLNTQALEKRNFINRWRDSTLAQPNWDGSWLACHLPKGGDRTQRNNSHKALDWFGFKAGLDQLWVRPNNLGKSTKDLLVELRKIGIESNTHCFVLSEVADQLASQWAISLWDIRSLDANYEKLISALTMSEKHLQSKSMSESLAETYQLGGEAIHCLATDPLLPKEIRPSQSYEALKAAMLRYDELGRNIWLEQLQPLTN